MPASRPSRSRSDEAVTANHGILECLRAIGVSAGGSAARFFAIVSKRAIHGVALKLLQSLVVLSLDYVKEELMLKALTCSAAAMLVLTAAPAGAQTKVLTGEQKQVTVTVEAIEQSTRQVTVKKPDGTNEMFYVPTSMKRFDQLKVGDKINARYYENVVVQLKQPGTADVDKSAAKLVPVAGAPAGTTSYQRTITATITAIDQKVPSITFSGPNGWKYSSRVEDKKALEKVKVGDRLDITWTEALILSVEN